MKMNPQIQGMISGMNKWTLANNGGFKQKWLAKISPEATSALDGLRKLKELGELSELQRREIDQVISSIAHQQNRFKS